MASWKLAGAVLRGLRQSAQSSIRQNGATLSPFITSAMRSGRGSSGVQNVYGNIRQMATFERKKPHVNI
ncbi:hypothetical protein TWF703_009805, partial [Orbilia oligospora]